MTSNPMPAGPSPGSVIVIGGGICGSTAAAVLAQAGWQVTLLDAHATHERHLAAALTPVISSDDDVRSKLSRLGAGMADRYWRSLGPQIGSPCGALQLQRGEGGKRVQDLQAQAAAYGDPGWAQWVSREQASELAGLDLLRGGIWFAGGWLIRVPELIRTLQASPGIKRVNTKIERLRLVAHRWEAVDASGRVTGEGDAVVLANAFDTIGLLERSGLDDTLNACRRLRALHRLAGEITLLPATDLRGGPKCIVGGDGYVLPAVDGWCVSGGTYVRGVEVACCTQAGRQANLARAKDLLGINPQTSGDCCDLPGWAGWRAVLPGRLPAIGQLPKARNLWVFSAAASRGLTWSVLGATLIREGLSGGRSMLDSSLMTAIEP